VNGWNRCDGQTGCHLLGDVLEFLLGQDYALPFETARIALALIGTGIAAYFDAFNNKNIPNWLLYGFLAVAFIANIAAYHEVLTLYAIIGGAAVFGLTYLLYRTGQWGGADGFILTSIVLLLPIQPETFLVFKSLTPSFFPFAFVLFINSGVLFMAYMFLTTIPTAVKALLKKGSVKLGAWLGACLITFAFAIFSYFTQSAGFFSPNYYLFLTLIVAFVVYYTLFKDSINLSMMAMVPISQVEEEDLIAIEKIGPDVVKKYSLVRLVDGGMLKRLKASHLKKVPVYVGLPMYIPFLLAGILLSLLVGNVVLFLAGNPF